jgi:transposase
VPRVQHHTAQTASRSCQNPPCPRPAGFHAGRYRQRKVVERCVNRLKQWRGIATRFDKRAANFRAAIVIVSLILWLA